MRKAIGLIAMLLSVLLFANAAFAQFTDREKRIYYDLLETSYFSSKKLDDIYAEVAGRHGITIEAVKNIWEKSFDQEPTAWEMSVADELIKRLDTLPKGASKEAQKRIYQEVAAKYGLTLVELYSIDDRCMEYWLW